MTTIVVGGGPAGLISAYFRAKRGERVILLEKNEKLGKKLYITGKGRCNVSNDCDVDEFLDNVATNAKFLTGASRRFPPEKFIEFLEAKVPLKVERGKRVFPVSDKASDITKALERYALEVGVEIRLNEKVTAVKANDGQVCEVATEKGTYPCDNVVLCTGGASYPSTGSSGDGYLFASKLGHEIVEPKPALVGINLKGDFFRALSGVTLKNVGVKIFDGQKQVRDDFGELLFTHFGVSGPTILSASSYVNRRDLSNLRIVVDLKPALSEKQLDERLLRDFAKYKNKTLKHSLEDLLLKGLIPCVLDFAHVDGEIKSCELKAADRKKIVETIKNFVLRPLSLRGLEEAIVTSGGVSVKDINAKTMESKKIKGLYFAGETVDVDALTGGFNITIAAMTAYAAGNA